eukprot:Skav210141  [mRNA]  locus=scaffold268:21657:25180:+ [translate_table: standard]
MHSWESSLPPTSSGAATLEFSPAQDSSLDSGKKCETAVSLDGEKGLGGITRWLAPKLDEFLLRHCKTLPTGRIFPLPSSNTGLAVEFPTSPPLLLMCLRNLVLGLNSLNGEGQDASKPCTEVQRGVLQFLHAQCDRFLKWDTNDELPEWEEFFRVRGIDYRGEEVLTAQPIEWENVSPALPHEVGSVALEEVVEHGSRHYVSCFEDYLLPVEDQVYVKPPKVMVPEHGWSKVCSGPLRLGVCQLIKEQDVYQVQDKPLLNGLFGVSKHEFSDGWEVRRLIMNLIPCNAICKSMDGDVSTLPSWSNMNALQLHPDENLVISSEDVREGRYYLCSSVLPMGFKNSVSLAQHVHRVIVKRALNSSELGIGGESEIRKDKPFSSSGHLFRIYLDNFDELKKVSRGMAEMVQGKVSPLALGLREEYLHLQGAIVDGTVGIAFPKPEKLVKYCHFGRRLLQQSHCTQRQAQVVGGGFVYIAMFRRPLLGSLNHIWKFITSCEGMPPVVRHVIPPQMKAEIARFISLVPLAFVDFRVSPSPVVTASDASEYGGGVTMSRGLTEGGVIAAGCSVRGDVIEPIEETSVLAIGLFDGIAALRVAMDALGWNVLGHVSVERDEAARRVVEAHFPSTIFVNDIALVTAELVSTWAGKFSQVSLVVLGAGPPCQGVSKLNAGRKGALKDERTSLFTHVPRVKGLLVKAFPWARVVHLMENVSSMDSQDLEAMSSAMEQQPYLVDGKDFTLARRPRFFWMDWELLPQAGVQVTPSSSSSWSDYNVVNVTATLEAKLYLEPGWTKTSDEPFPAFTTSRCREHPGRRPAGLVQCQPHEVERWKNDWHRYPPYQYRDCHLVRNRQGQLRLPSAAERECILGFPRDFTMASFAKAQQGSFEHEEKRLTLLGNTWCVPVVAWLLNHLGAVLGLHALRSPADIISRCAPGSTTNLQAYLLRRPMIGNKPVQSLRREQELQLVQKLSSLVSLKGEGLLLQSASEEVVRYHRLRASVPSQLWKWSTAASWKWLGGREHINVLEMRAVLCALRWRLERTCQVRIKLVHLVDSQVVLHALSRGRSSSRKLRRTLLRINSLLLATGSHVVWTYVHTKQNPADRPSRRPQKRKWKHAKTDS